MTHVALDTPAGRRRPGAWYREVTATHLVIVLLWLGPETRGRRFHAHD